MNTNYQFLHINVLKLDKNLTISYRMSEHNFADNKYIRKDIRLKTAENKKYRAKRIGRNHHNNKSTKHLQNHLDDYVDVLNLITDSIEVITESDLTCNSIHSTNPNNIDEILKEFEIL